MTCENDKKGTLAEIKVAMSLIRKGYTVSLPFAAKAAYDCLFDDGIKIHKVQVKYGKESTNQQNITFHTCTFRKNAEGKTESFCRKDEVDYYGVYVETLDTCYLIPSSIVSKRQMSLRLGSADGYCPNLAKDFIL